MFKKIIALSILNFALNQVAFATQTAENSNADPLNLAGKYSCYGYDSHDGGYDNAILTLTLDSKNSDFKNNHGAYHFNLTENDVIKYIGAAAASGNNLAIYFENISKDEPTDRGVGIAFVIHDKNLKGKSTTELHKFYYEEKYMGGGNGSETCVKKD